MQNLIFLRDFMEYLPRNLLSFELDLSYNSLGYNKEYMKYLRDGMKWLPNNLQVLNV